MEEIVEQKEEIVGEELQQIHPHPTPFAFRYIVTSAKMSLDKVKFTIIAASATDAKEGLKKNLADDATILFDGKSPFIMQF
jgi:hypothetical protein